MERNYKLIAISEPYYNSGQGGVHLYDLDGSSYMTITPSDQSSGDYENFGNSVAMDHGKIIVGSPADDTPNTNQGSAYIFDRFGIQLKKLVASDGSSNDLFGTSVVLITSSLSSTEKKATRTQCVSHCWMFSFLSISS